jgi:hypothetical protein
VGRLVCLIRSILGHNDSVPLGCSGRLSSILPLGVGVVFVTIERCPLGCDGLSLGRRLKSVLVGCGAVVTVQLGELGAILGVRLGFRIESR